MAEDKSVAFVASEPADDQTENPQTFAPGNLEREPRKHMLWSSVYFLHKRERGNVFNVDTAMSNYYKYISPSELWDFNNQHGAVFNVEFSPSGSLLVAACEGQSLLLFDPINHQMLKSVKTSHTDCVNCVRFLDTRTFAVCSDDKSISLWDVRNLSCELLRLQGHTNWVKSIEFHRPTRQLVSSAFDDTVRVWDLNGYHDSETPQGRVVLRFSNLTRMKLGPDGTHMVISAIPGNMTVIHNLNLDNLFTDFKEAFWSSELGTHYPEPRVDKTRNIVETFDEFPEQCAPWCISSLEVHPYSWCVLSRFTSRGSRREWTAVHDIQTTSVEKSSGHVAFSEESRESLQRLTHSIEEPNVAKGYIKEHCFSKDGRVVCSPFGNSARLLSFNQTCDEMPKCLKSSPSELHELKTLIKHKHSVLTCRFSPTQMLLATGCLGGGVCFHQPHL